MRLFINYNCWGIFWKWSKIEMSWIVRSIVSVLFLSGMGTSYKVNGDKFRKIWRGNSWNLNEEGWWDINKDWWRQSVRLDKYERQVRWMYVQRLHGIWFEAFWVGISVIYTGQTTTTPLQRNRGISSSYSLSLIFLNRLATTSNLNSIANFAGFEYRRKYSRLHP